MGEIIEFLKTLHSVEGIQTLLRTGGLVAIVGIIFSETGLLVGFFLPGDSLLVTAGIFAASNGAGGPPIFNLYVLMVLVALAAVVGDQVGYFLGTRASHFIYQRPDGFFFKKKNLRDAHDFYEKYGARALVMARFVPIFRTFVPFVAGMAAMPYKRFLTVSVVGGILWTWSLIPLGYFLGQTPLANELHKVILVIIFVSVIPIGVSFVRGVLGRVRAKQGI